MNDIFKEMEKCIDLFFSQSDEFVQKYSNVPHGTK